MKETKFEIFEPTVPMVREWLQSQPAGRRVYNGPTSNTHCLIANLAKDHGLQNVNVGVRGLHYDVRPFRQDVRLSDEISGLIYDCISWMSAHRRKTMTAAEVLQLLEQSSAPAGGGRDE